MDDPQLRHQALERFLALIWTNHDEAKYLMLRILQSEKDFEPDKYCPTAILLNLCDSRSIHTHAGLCIPHRFGIDGDGFVKKLEDFGTSYDVLLANAKRK